MSRNAVESIGIDNLAKMNQGGNAGVTININGNMIGNESFVESDYISESSKIIGDVKGNPKVTIDVGGGAAKNFAKTLLERIGCEVNTINENLLTSSRGPDPTVETLDDLIKNT